MGPDDLGIGCGIKAKFHIDDPVNSTAGGEAQYRFGNILRAVVDEVVRSGGLGMVRFFWPADGGDDGGTPQFCHLNGIVADCTRPAGDEDGLVFNRAIGKNAMMSRGRGNAQAGPYIKGGVFWQRHRLFGGQGDIFRCGSKGALPLGIPRPDPLPKALGGDVGACCRYDPGPVAMGNDPGPGQSGPSGSGARSGFDVGWIDAGGTKLDQHFMGAGLGIWKRPMDKNLKGFASFFIPYGPHFNARLSVADVYSSYFSFLSVVLITESVLSLFIL
jgi:hypothetical protein